MYLYNIASGINDDNKSQNDRTRIRCNELQSEKGNEVMYNKTMMFVHCSSFLRLCSFLHHIWGFNIINDNIQLLLLVRILLLV